MTAETNGGNCNFPDDEEPASIELRRRVQNNGLFEVVEHDLLYLQEDGGIPARRLRRTYYYSAPIRPASKCEIELVKLGDDPVYLPETVAKDGEYPSQQDLISFRDQVNPDWEELYIRINYADGIDRKIRPTLLFRYKPETRTLTDIWSFTDIWSLSYDPAGNQINRDIKIKDHREVPFVASGLVIAYNCPDQTVRVRAESGISGDRLLPLIALRVPLQVSRERIIQELFPDKALLEDPFNGPTYMDRSWLETDLKRVFGIEDDIQKDFTDKFSRR